MATAEDGLVLGDFSAPEVPLAEGVVVPRRQGDKPVFEVRLPDGRTEVHAVDLLIASGRQQQVYLSRTDAGSYALLPLFWATRANKWIPTSAYLDIVLDPASPKYWKDKDIQTVGCFQCHLSQAFYEVGDGDPTPSWVDLPVNCEACHGPGKDHVDARRAGKTEPTFRDLKALSQHDEARACGQCHGRRASYTFDNEGLRTSPPTTLAHSAFRVNATQVGTGYQLAGHLVSDCYLRGGMRCDSCHDPHTGDAVDLAGRTAEGEHTNRQCTTCHRNLIDDLAAADHGHHDPKKATCVDCHMSMSWMFDDPAIAQRTSDHSISIPRPAEAEAFALPDACHTCHTERTHGWALDQLKAWGATRALEVRPWVRAIDAGRKRTPGAAELLVGVLADERNGPYLQASALELLGQQEPTRAVIDAIEPFADHPDPQLRAFALRALVHHDKRRIRTWSTRAMTDEHPYVRLENFRPSARQPEEHFERALHDLLHHSERPPGRQLFDIARDRAERGDVDRARELVVDAVRMSPVSAIRALDGWPGWIANNQAIAPAFFDALCERGQPEACEIAARPAQ